LEKQVHKEMQVFRVQQVHKGQLDQLVLKVPQEQTAQTELMVLLVLLVHREHRDQQVLKVLKDQLDHKVQQEPMVQTEIQDR
jgi:hypothetical protein